MIALDKIKQGLPLCKFPRESYNHIAAILELLRAGRGVRLDQEGDRWTISIDDEWLSGFIEKDVSPMVDASENSVADHYGKTHSSTAVKTLGEDDEWRIEEENEVLTEAKRPLKIPGMVFGFSIKKVNDYKYTFSWNDTDVRIDTTGNVYLVVSKETKSQDLVIPNDDPDPGPDPDPGGGGSGDDDDDDGPGSGSGGGGSGGYDGPAPECGNPINNPGKGGGGRDDDRDNGDNPIDEPGPGGNTPECGEGEDDDDDYPL